MTHPDTLQIPRAVVEQAISKALAYLEPPIGEMGITAARATLKSLQAQPTPPVGLTEQLLSDYQELNMSNFTDDDVSWLNEWAIRAFHALSSYPENPQPTPPVRQSAAGAVATKAPPYLHERLKDFTCTKVENAGGAPGLTLYKTKLGAHPEYQLYDSEALALYINLGKALSPLYIKPQPTPDAEAIRLALEIIRMQRDWIMAVPQETQLPAMPGFDRDWVDDRIAALEKVKGPTP